MTSCAVRGEMQQEVKIDNETSEMENCVSTHGIVCDRLTGISNIQQKLSRYPQFSPVHLSWKRVLNIEDEESNRKQAKMYLRMERNSDDFHLHTS